MLITLKHSNVTHPNSIHILFSFAINLEWPIYQLDVKNALYRATSGVWCTENMILQTKSSTVIAAIIFQASIWSLHFVWCTTSEFALLTIYVDDILLKYTMSWAGWRKIILSSTLWPKIWKTQRTFLGLKLNIITMEYFFLKKKVRIGSITRDWSTWMQTY